MAVSSGVWAGAVPIQDAWDLEEVTPHQGQAKTMLQELDRIGYRGEIPASHESNPFAAHFELHIEQGPILEDEGLKIGVVQGRHPQHGTCIWKPNGHQVCKPSSGSLLPSEAEIAMRAPRRSTPAKTLSLWPPK